MFVFAKDFLKIELGHVAHEAFGCEGLDAALSSDLLGGTIKLAGRSTEGHKTLMVFFLAGQPGGKGNLIVLNTNVLQMNHIH